MDSSPHPCHRPVRVTLAHEDELVETGFATMLAPHSSRVTVVPGYSDGCPARDVDLTLHDSLSSLHPCPAPVMRVPDAYDGQLVTYTWRPSPDLVELVLANGSRGCLSKALPASGLVAALEAIHRGEVVVEYGVREARRKAAPPSAPLTPREAQVVALITRGFDNFSIAREASLSINSVKTYIRSAYRKMGVRSRSQAVLWGVRHGYLDEVPGPARSAGLTG